jgi:hypothetical protein
LRNFGNSEKYFETKLVQRQSWLKVCTVSAIVSFIRLWNLYIETKGYKKTKNGGNEIYETQQDTVN